MSLRNDGSWMMALKNHQLRDAVKTLAGGILLTVGAFWLWYFLIGLPLDDLALIQRGKVVPGFIVDTWEDVEVESRREGGTTWSSAAIYEYRLPDGRDFKGVSKGSSRLKDELRYLTEPLPIEVEYLPDNPNVSRIKGDGCQSVTEWLWRKVGLGGLFLLAFLAPGFIYLRDGVRAVMRMRTATRSLHRPVTKNTCSEERNHGRD